MSENLVKVDSLESLEPFLQEHAYKAEDVRDGWYLIPSWIPNLFGTQPIAELLAGKAEHYPLPEGIAPDDKANAENFWVIREVARFEFGVYKKQMPKHFERLRAKRPDLWWHFVHVSVDDPTMVAYTPSAEYGKRDRQVRTKVGKYITQFYCEHLSSEEIRAIANMCKPNEVKFAATREEITRVYVEGPGSCMSGDSWGSRHPCEVYEGDFRLGFIEDSSGGILARGLVHDPSKTWVRVYGDEGQTLADAFRSMGFERANAWPNGAKLKRIERGDGVLMPYIDGGVQSVTDCGSHFEISSDGEYSCTGTNGYLDLDDHLTECDNCGGRYDAEEEGAYSEHHDMRICPNCEDRHFVYAYTGRRHQDYVREDEVIEVAGEYYVNDTTVLADHDIHECAYSCEFFHLDELVTTADGDLVHSDYVVCVGADEHDEQKYASISEINLDYTVHFDPAQNTVLMLVHPDFTVDTHTQELFPETMRTLKMRDFLAEYHPQEVQWREGLLPYKRVVFMSRVNELRIRVTRDQAVAA